MVILFCHPFISRLIFFTSSCFIYKHSHQTRHLPSHKSKKAEAFSCFASLLCFLCQGLSCVCQDGVFPWLWWPALWCWVASCWCLQWHTSVVTGRYSKLLSSVLCCWCCPTSGKEKTWASALLHQRLKSYQPLQLWEMWFSCNKNLRRLVFRIYIVQIKS